MTDPARRLLSGMAGLLAIARAPGYDFDELLDDDVVDAEVHCEGCNCPTICSCGREMYGEPESPDGPTYWFHRDDDTSIAACAYVPGEVSAEPLPAAPSPGIGRSTAELLNAARDWILTTLESGSSVASWPDTRLLVAELRARAAELDAEPVTHEDLAAHLTAIRIAWADQDINHRGLSEEIAHHLLADYVITSK